MVGANGLDREIGLSQLRAEVPGGLVKPWKRLPANDVMSEADLFAASMGDTVLSFETRELIAA